MDNKTLISQYVDTGRQLPQYQVNKLSNNDKKTYIRKRMIAVTVSGDDFDFYEYNLLDEESKKKYILLLANRDFYFPIEMLRDSSDEIKEFYINTIIFREDSLNLNSFLELSDELKLKYMKYRIKNMYGVGDSFIKHLTPEMFYEYQKLLARYSRFINDEKFLSLPNELKQIYLDTNFNGEDSEVKYNERTPESKLKYILAIKNRHLTPVQLFKTPDDLAMVYLKQRLSQGWDLKNNEIERYNKLNGQ